MTQLPHDCYHPHQFSLGLYFISSIFCYSSTIGSLRIYRKGGVHIVYVSERGIHEYNIEFGFMIDFYIFLKVLKNVYVKH